MGLDNCWRSLWVPDIERRLLGARPLETGDVGSQACLPEDGPALVVGEAPVACKQLSLRHRKNQQDVGHAGLGHLVAKPVPKPAITKRVIDDHVQSSSAALMELRQLNAQGLRPCRLGQTFSPEGKASLSVDLVRGDDGGIESVGECAGGGRFSGQ